MSKFDETEPGGKYLAPDGLTWVDANGKELGAVKAKSSDSKAAKDAPEKGSEGDAQENSNQATPEKEPKTKSAENEPKA